MDCLPMDTLCELQQDFAVYVSEDKVEYTKIGIFNGRNYYFGTSNGKNFIYIEKNSSDVNYNLLGG